jgi:DNA-binding transcriptional MerR regulator
MPVSLNGNKFYLTAEACEKAGTSKNTFLRWVREGTFDDVRLRNRNGWRLFTDNDLKRLTIIVQRIRIINK